MTESNGRKRNVWFWAGATLLSLSALWWLVLIVVDPGDIGGWVLTGVVTTVVPIGIGIYGTMRGMRAPLEKRLTEVSPEGNPNPIRNRKSEEQSTDDSRSSPVESLSEAVIRKGLRSDAIQHPVTIVSLAIAILSIIYLVLFSWLLGGSLGAIIILICSGLVAAASFLWHYSIRYTEAYEKRVKEIMALQDQEQRGLEEAGLQRSRETLESGFSSLNSTEGLKAVQEVAYEYEQLQPIIESGKETDPLSIAYVPPLAEETYRQGLNVLTDAFEMMKAIDLSDKKRLEAEAVDLEKEIESLRKKETGSGRLKIREATLTSHKQRLDMMKQQQLQVDKLFYQSELCEASLHRTRMELTALKADSSKTSVSAVTATLQKTIDQAKEVREEMKKLGY